MRKYTLFMGYYFRKNRGQYISFCFIVAIAAAIFSMGLITILNFGKMYEKKFQQYNCADVFYTMFDFDWPEDLAAQAEALDGGLHRLKPEVISCYPVQPPTVIPVTP